MIIAGSDKCQLDETFQCKNCGKQFKHARSIMDCPKGKPYTPGSPRKPIELNPMLAIIRETKFCSGCEFFKPDRGTDAPVCVLIDCGCGAGSTPQQKAIALTKRWAIHLANTNSRCLLPGKPKFGTMEEMHAEEAKDLPRRYAEFDPADNSGIEQA